MSSRVVTGSSAKAVKKRPPGGHFAIYVASDDDEASGCQLPGNDCFGGDQLVMTELCKIMGNKDMDSKQ